MRHIVEKFADADAKNSNFNNKMDFLKKSIKEVIEGRDNVSNQDIASLKTAGVDPQNSLK